jgi:hypothetical protein
MSRDYEEKVLESELREHLSAELDGQLGRSKRAFREYIVRTRVHAPVVVIKTSAEPIFRAKFWTISVGGAIAAAVACFWIVPQVFHRAAPTSVTNHSSPTAPRLDVSASALLADGGGEWEQVEKVVSTMTVDDGLFIIDDRTPARLVRQVEMERMQWIDQRRGVRIETVVPRENVQLITLDTY